MFGVGVAVGVGLRFPLGLNERHFLYLHTTSTPQMDSYPLLGSAGAMAHIGIICGVHGDCLGLALV